MELNINKHRWRSINGTVGVISIVMFGDSPAPLPVGVVEELLRRVDKDDVLNNYSEIKVGQNVEINDGPFMGMVGTILSLNDKGRVELLLKFLNHSARISARCASKLAIKPVLPPSGNIKN